LREKRIPSLGALVNYVATERSQLQSEGSTSESDINDLLNWDVFVTLGIPVVITDLAPGAKQRMWSPMSSTLIYGKRDAVLVDAFIAVEQADAWSTGSRRAART
jgi:hypothetical protein